MYREKIQAALKQFETEKIPHNPPEHLPLLEEFRKQRLNVRTLDGVEALFIQHHLGPLVPRLRTMIDDDLAVERCWLVDIPYSTNERVRDHIRSMVGKEQMAVPMNDPLEPYAERQRQRVEHIVRGLAAREGWRRLLVVDDGAYFIRLLQSLRSSDPDLVNAFKGRVHIVEQTTRGHRYLESKKYQEMAAVLEAPIVSVARCKTKIEFESPFIGASTVRALKNALAEEGVLERGLGRVAIIGFGPVGQSVFDVLKNVPHEGPIDIVEIDEKKYAMIKPPYARATRSLPRTEAYNLVVGCTGYTSFDLSARFCLAPNAHLVSTSSAAIEFNREGFIELANALPDDEIEILEPEETRASGIHATIRMRDHERQFAFLHAGFPVNFDGEIECVPARFIQATHTLLYSAAHQVLRSSGSGMVPIDCDDDEWILREAFRHI